MDKKGRRRSKNSTTSQHTHTIPHTTKRNRYHFRTGKAPNTPHVSDSDRTDPSATASIRVSPVTTRPTLSYSLALLEDDCQKNARRHSKVHHHHSFDALESILEKVTLMLKNPS
mmetsp:Transcript_25349/g.28922  ORF Transcript_25349/g.28922 Transcript_25349/m.28922 type:complete len:114 (+) Transcript_25349:149-490(+)